MEYKELYLFVEGNDDMRFFNEIIKTTRLKAKYYSIKIVQHRQPKDKEINKIIKSIQAKDEYIFIVDIGGSPCISCKKAKLKDQYSNLDEEKNNYCKT